jgi:hypothetical protein
LPASSAGAGGGGGGAAAAAALLVLLALTVTAKAYIVTRMADAAQAHAEPTQPSSNVTTAAAAGAATAKGAIQWTAAKVAITCALFVFAGLAGASRVEVVLRCLACNCGCRAAFVTDSLHS